MLRTIRKFIFGALFVLGFLALLAFNVALIWVATGPRDIGAAIPHIEKGLSAPDGSYHVSIESGILVWDGWRNPLDIRLKNVTVASPAARIARFPGVSLSLHLPSLLAGRIAPASVTLRAPVIRLKRTAEGITLGIEEQETEEAREDEPPDVALKSWQDAVERISALPRLRKLRKIAIENALILVRDETGAPVLRVEKAGIHIKRGWGGIDSVLTAQLPYGEKNYGSLHVQASIPRDAPYFDVQAKIANIVPSRFSAVSGLDGLAGLNVPVSGELDTRIGKALLLPEQAQFEVYAGKGEAAPSVLEKPLTIEGAQLRGSIDGSALHIERFEANFGRPQLSATGTLTHTPEGTGIALDAALTQADISDLAMLWPKTLSPMTREWVTESIRAGAIPQATVRVSIPPGHPEPLPDGAIEAHIAFQDASLRYKPGHPEVTHLKGTASFTANTMSAAIESARHMDSGLITNGLVRIDDLNAPNPKIDLQFDAQAQARDIAAFLALPDMGHAQRLNIDPAAVTGAATGKIKLGFHFFAPRDEQGNVKNDGGVEYDIRAALEGVSIPGFMHKYDVLQAKGDFGIDNAQLDFAGDGQVNGVPAAASVRYRFVPDKDGSDTWVEARAPDVPADALAKFGYQVPESFLSGVMGVDLKLRQGASFDRAELSLDLARAALGIDALKWQKPTGVPATARFTLVQEGSGADMRIEAFEYASADEAASGSAVVGKGFDFKEIEAPVFRLGGSDLALSYAPIKGGYRVHAKGAKADISRFLEGNIGKEGEGFAFSKIPALDVDITADALITQEGRTIHHFKGSAQCGSETCAALALSGTVGQGAPFHFRITKQGEARKLEARAEDAGAFLRAATIFDGIEGGTLLLDGSYDDHAPNHPLSGKLIITEHSIRDVPLLAKLLSLASLTGMVDTLSGKGITFKRLTVPFTLRNDVIRLQDARSYGPAVGLTAEGEVRFPGAELDLKGVVVPSYTLNSFFSNIPLLGDVIAGGKGEGIIAARYTMKGKPEQAEISVNPLSMLTPGFLRGIFDLFDAKEKEPQP